ncbi:MAG: hypothetical protein ACJARY_002155 [Candidatus Azotimanducaceae bacterium]|jgi:hypothetical protein
MIAENLITYAFIVFLLMATGLVLTVWGFTGSRKRKHQQEAKAQTSDKLNAG